MFIGVAQVIKDFKGSRLTYITIKGLGSPKATPNLDIKSRGLNYTTIVV